VAQIDKSLFGSPGGQDFSSEKDLLSVIIFRHNLFKLSEPFITQQAERLRRYRPVYMGRLRYGAAPAGAEALSLRELGAGWPLAVAWQLLARSPLPFLRLLEGRRPSLVHAHFGVDGVYALKLARHLGVPLVTTFHGFDATLSTAALLASPAYANYPLFRRRLARQGRLFLCASGFLRDRLLGLGFPAAATRVHYIGVDCEAILPRPAEAERLTVLHVARLVEVKGTEFLIRAFAAAAVASAALVIIGDGPLRGRLERLARELGIGGRVQFLGALPHAAVLGWMQQAAMLVLPGVRTATGREEGLGMVMLEAAATGVPVIGSRVGGIVEAVADGETGFLVPERDVAALAGRIGDLLADAELRRRLGGQGRARVERVFDLGRQTAVLEGFYDECRAEAGAAALRGEDDGAVAEQV
jgi:glycosyltransferase involved in cell wall biosynthesis